MPRIPPVTTAGLDDTNRRRRHREVTDLMLNFQHDDSRIRTPAEISDGVTPVNYAYAPGDPRRYGRDYDGSTPPNSTRIVPTGLSWAGIVPIFCGAPGKCQFSEDVIAYARRTSASFISAGACYVDPVNGSDANTGGISDPVKTISYAVRTLLTTQVYCLPGVYAPFDYRDTDASWTPNKRLKVVTALGPCYIRNAVDDPVTATWTADGGFPNVFWMALTPANPAPCAVLDLSRLDLVGQPVPLEQRTTIANCNTVNTDPGTSHGSWFYDSGANRLYVRMGAIPGSSFRAQLKIVTGDSATRILVLGTWLAMEGDWHLEGVFPYALQSSSVRPIFFMQCPPSDQPNISYTGGSGTPCVESEGGDTLLEGVWGHRGKIDTFHYVDSGGIASRGIEIDCRSTFAGDIYTTRITALNAGASNGSSSHDGGSILRINGEYLYGDGPDVADACSNGSWNVGVVSGGSTVVGNSYGFYALAGTMWLDTCMTLDETSSEIRAEGSGVTLKLFQTSYRTSTTASGGTITTYLPQVPG